MSEMPTYAELLGRIERADDIACDGIVERHCTYCKLAVEMLRGGSLCCSECGHINAIGHSCEDWKAYDAGEITLDEVSRRSKETRSVEQASSANPAGGPPSTDKSPGRLSPGERLAPASRSAAPAEQTCECTGDHGALGLFIWRGDPDWWSCSCCDGRVRPLTAEERAAR